ncbi:MAG: outer membrane beta-barrel protein [Bacteroidales bacterium]|nr:outer membrane beta-barrel protein [Bacteroidales bacterium]
MNKRFLLTILTVAFAATAGFSQLTFNVSPGLNLNSASFGYKINDRIIPYVGFQYMNSSINYEYKRTSTNPTDEGYETDETLKTSLFIPNIGVKAFLVSKNDIKAYANVMLSMPIVNSEFEDDGEIEEDYRDVVESINLFGVQAGVGCEYFFSENFSLGGEFGFRYFRFKTEREETDTYDGFDNTQTTTRETKYTANVSPTYNKISLNFYF